MRRSHLIPFVRPRITRLRLNRDIYPYKQADVNNILYSRGATRLSEEHGGSGNHCKHPQPLPPLNPYESHDNHVNDAFRAWKELEGEFGATEGARPVELCNDSLRAV